MKFKKNVIILFFIIFGISSYILYTNHGASHWGPDFKIIKIKSNKDNTDQKSYYYKSRSPAKEPLVVSLHSWSGNYNQIASSLAIQTKERNWNYIHPDARGANNTMKACCSDFAISDIDEAIDWALKNLNVDKNRIYVVGGSGGGYETLCMFMKSRHKIATFAAWCPITDLAAWYEESLLRKNSYAGDIIRCTASKNGCLDIEKARERSPLHWKTPIEKLKFSKLKIYAGIRDGHTGPVPFTHATRFYNKILGELNIKDGSRYVSEDEVAYMDKNGAFPIQKVEKIGDRTVFYKKQQNNIELIIFDGGHDLLEEYALDLL